MAGNHIWTNAPPPGGHVFQATGTIFELVRYIIGTHFLTKCHDDRIINVASRLLTRENATTPWRPCFSTNRNHFQTHPRYHWDKLKNAPSPGVHVLKATETIFELIQDIIGTNLLTKFHEDRKINVASRPYKEKCPAPWRPFFFKPTGINFLLVQDIIVMNLLTKFHEDLTINVASRVKNAPPLATNLLTKIHEDWTINEASRTFNEKCPPLGGHVFMNDRKINVASRVLTRKNAPPPDGHVFQPTGIIFKLVHDIIVINLLTKFHKDRTINVASRVLTRF
ncbi:hypothetical protein DPMN_062846 [Dreissena polymorpha]|uniref:Uncharacterized protein n=1 Tax=Dreissena polymorpha TaxID=45954 RepID=A0A9D4HKI8_DREPO|nr:hypothetical protein DPMN_062846 [Dreissena polymorpha]